MISMTLKRQNWEEPLNGSDGKLPYFIKNGINWFVTEIATSKKSMMLMILKHQNWVESLSGNEKVGYKPCHSLEKLVSRKFHVG